ncbi:hypothetical protein J7K91_01835 [bacterium]|nr:hypothetical protein [bacterium]
MLEKSEVEKILKQRIEEGSALRELANTRGWEILKKIFEDLKKELDSIKNIDKENLTPEMILARRIALEFLETFWGEIIYKIESVEENQKKLENLNKTDRYIVRK